LLKAEIDAATLGDNVEVSVERWKSLCSKYGRISERLFASIRTYLTVLRSDRRNSSVEYQFLYDPIEIELRQGGAYRSFSSLSFGQRSAIILKFVLRSDDSRILVIDQPEDHLDAYGIVQIVSPTLNQLAAQRQVLVATHNSSLLLSLRPDTVVVLESTGEYGRLRTVGSIERNEIVQAVLEVLEGGSDTFQRKIDLYKDFVRTAALGVDDDIRTIEAAFRRRTVDELRNELQPAFSDRELLDVLRHELKNALAGSNRIAVDIGEVRRPLSSRSVEETLEALGQLSTRLDRQITRFQQSVEEIRLFETSPNPEVISVYDFLVECKKANSVVSSHRLIRIDVDEELRGIMAFADRNHMKLVFGNLIKNALRATERRASDELVRGRPVEAELVSMSVHGASAQEVYIAVEDNGCGIPESVLGKLYSEATSDQDGKGHGLGGLIIKRLLELNDGGIQIKSTRRGQTVQVVRLGLAGK
jgi:signal transduction histidine kinase